MIVVIGNLITGSSKNLMTEPISEEEEAYIKERMDFLNALRDECLGYTTKIIQSAERNDIDATQALLMDISARLAVVTVQLEGMTLFIKKIMEIQVAQNRREQGDLWREIGKWRIR